MKKIFFLFSLVIFSLISCASNEATKAYRPVKIEINFTKPDMAIISASYSGRSWLFIEGVEFCNAAGEKKRYTFKKPSRRILKGGSVSEFGVLTLQDYTIDEVSFRGVAKLRDFIGSGEITGRVIADSVTLFQPVDIYN